MIDLGGAPFANIPAGFGGLIAEYTDKWPKVIHVAKYQARVTLAWLAVSPLALFLTTIAFFRIQYQLGQT